MITYIFKRYAFVKSVNSYVFMYLRNANLNIYTY